MNALISGTRIHPERTQHSCQRCGIDHTPSDNIDPERAKYCQDCRPLATQLGWCAPRKPRQSLVAA